MQFGLFPSCCMYYRQRHRVPAASPYNLQQVTLFSSIHHVCNAAIQAYDRIGNCKEAVSKMSNPNIIHVAMADGRRQQCSACIDKPTHHLVSELNTRMLYKAGLLVTDRGRLRVGRPADVRGDNTQGVQTLITTRTRGREDD